MMRLLDTSVCIPLINGTDARMRSVCSPTGSVGLCSVVRAEFCFGAHNSARSVENLQKFPVIAELLGRRFAVIEGEEHSSQSAESTKSLKAVLAAGSVEATERAVAGIRTLVQQCMHQSGSDVNPRAREEDLGHEDSIHGSM